MRASSCARAVALATPTPRRARCARGRRVARSALETGKPETRDRDAKRAKEALKREEADDEALRVRDVVDGVGAVVFKHENRRTFEVEYGAKKGSSENAYVIEGGEASMLVDTPDGTHARNYAAAIGTFGASARDAAYHAMLHVAPRRLDALAAAIANRGPEAAPVEVLCTNPGAQLIQQALKAESPLANERLIEAWKNDKGKLRARLRVVRNGESIDLGGRTVRFTLAPTPRWPDLMFVRDEKTQALFTSKFFSAHTGQAPGLTDEGGFEAFGEDWRFYFDCLLAPMSRQVDPLLARLPLKEEQLAKASAPVMKDKRNMFERMLSVKKREEPVGAEIDLYEGLASAIFPSHGPMVLSSVTELYREYKEWAAKAEASAESASVAIIYASAYGNTGAMAQAIARGVAKTGIRAEMFNCELASPSDVREVLKRSAGFALGAPTLGGTLPTPVQTALGEIVKDGDLEKPCGAFGSFGWSGEAVGMIADRLKDAGFKSAFEPLRCKFKPTSETLQLCEESGTDLAQAVRQKARRKQVLDRKLSPTSFAAGNDVDAAVGRIVGSLCAVTTKKDETQSAMLASWVSQASFNPPAITVAVAKDRAVESFLMTGGKFNLNVLKDGDEKQVVKALLKPFAPGENRFGDLDVDISENNGCAVVKRALACVECSVVRRMEAGDHWVVLAEVETGTLLDADGLTCIHHRKTGVSY
ncbi:Beta-lactamase-like [Ostreococcus tauri]|uniref:Beta-lactamase-like n=1 Tax=Ostreococcus tauri TaxID=70448 RepID=A0A090M7X2_OSTTA|nr:Beta-lactamase-like [Ostreococcus tauri]OUS42218.1 hypothetical protein BE221DRAFT_202151 [Ostreococcus tauri]CEG01138.1 Beta-lactamase-like [Ostreococcus tauri]|eukprot:XP_003075211.2 Beta-lactamase-like [Ostreococcus tauri]